MSKQIAVVVFDLGGVIVRICQTWQEALRVANVSSPLLEEPSLPLIDFGPFNAYQATELPLETYLDELAAFLGCTSEEALKIHLSILITPYPGIDQAIDRIKDAGIVTGCLSNTNAPHWHAMTETAPFAPVAKLEFRAGSHELGCAKPDPNAFIRYAEKFGLQNSPIIYFDDSKTNVEVAIKLGWDAHPIDPWGDPATEIMEILSRSPLISGL
jgi:putative hydrolase of the HAD superfamily